MSENPSMSKVAHGIKTVYTAELLVVFAGICFILSIIIQTAVGLFSILSLVLLLFAFFIQLKGLKICSTEDKGYKLAFELTLGMIFAAVLGAVLNAIWPNVFAGDSENTLLKIVSMMVSYYMITTTVRLLQEKGAEKEAAAGKTALYLIIGAYLAEAVLDLVVLFAKVSTPLAIVAIVLAIVELIGSILYLIFLGKAWPKL